MPTTVTIQQEALAYAIASIIWKSGNGQSATLCLPQPNVVHVVGSPQFNEDGLTEKVSFINYCLAAILNKTCFVISRWPDLVKTQFFSRYSCNFVKWTELKNYTTPSDAIFTWWALSMIVSYNVHSLNFWVLSVSRGSWSSCYVDFVQCHFNERNQPVRIYTSALENIIKRNRKRINENGDNSTR